MYVNFPVRLLYVRSPLPLAAGLGLITYKSSNPFEFFHILNSKKQDEQDMSGTLIFPEKKKKTYPFCFEKTNKSWT